MMSIPSITTWSSDLHAFADVEGTALLFTEDAVYLALFPDEKIVIPPKQGCWEQLKKQLKNHFYVGFLSYEMGYFADPDYHIEGPKTTLPATIFYRPTTVIRYTDKGQTVYGKPLPDRPQRVMGPIEMHLASQSDTHSSYLAKIALIKEQIEAGEIYQANLSQSFQFEGKVDPCDLFEQLYTQNPAPYSAFINCGEFQIVSSSPELFLKKRGSQIRTCPIKGTAPRLEGEKERLLASEKERSELLMITDLMRNDLSKICDPTTVEVLKMWECQTFTDVYHLVSTIEGQVKQELHPVDQIRQLFPGGSITGCPKLRAMEVIADIEKGLEAYIQAPLDIFLLVVITALI